MIGATQILVLGYKQPELPVGIREQINQLRSNSAVRLVDVYGFNKAGNRVITEQAVSGLDDWDGVIIKRILESASASSAASPKPPITTAMKEKLEPR